MEITPASLSQVTRARDGRLVAVEDDAQNVVNDICAIDPSLRVRYAETSEAFIVYQQHLDGRETLVTTAQELDPRLVERVQKITHPSYDLKAEMERVDAQAEKDQDHAFEEKVGEAGERLAHAIRKDLQHKGKVFIPRDSDA